MTCQPLIAPQAFINNFLFLSNALSIDYVPVFLLEGTIQLNLYFIYTNSVEIRWFHIVSNKMTIAIVALLDSRLSLLYIQILFLSNIRPRALILNRDLLLEDKGFIISLRSSLLFSPVLELLDSPKKCIAYLLFPQYLNYRLEKSILQSGTLISKNYSLSSC